MSSLFFFFSEKSFSFFVCNIFRVLFVHTQLRRKTAQKRIRMTKQKCFGCRTFVSRKEGGIENSKLLLDLLVEKESIFEFYSWFSQLSYNLPKDNNSNLLFWIRSFLPLQISNFLWINLKRSRWNDKSMPWMRSNKEQHHLQWNKWIKH